MISKWRLTPFYLMILILLPEVAVYNIRNKMEERPFLDERQIQDLCSSLINAHIRNIQSDFSGYKEGPKREYSMETDTTLDSKYQIRKRNADLINSLLALPKWMNEAGR